MRQRHAIAGRQADQLVFGERVLELSGRARTYFLQFKDDLGLAIHGEQRIRHDVHKEHERDVEGACALRIVNVRWEHRNSG